MPSSRAPSPALSTNSSHSSPWIRKPLSVVHQQESSLSLAAAAASANGENDEGNRAGSFFGYLGYDEVCCVAGEAKHPKRDMPRAVLGTLATVTLCYVLAAMALTGMLPYTEISATAGFPDAFRTRQWEWAAEITSAGEILTLPVVVIISLMAQPRLTLSMAMDGLLPRIFGSVDSGGNLRGGTLISGIAMTAIATFVPFTYLDDLISAGILVAFCMTNSCLVLLRCESPIHQTGLLEILLAVYNALCFVSSMLWTHNWSYLPFQRVLACIFTLAAVSVVFKMALSCPRTMHFGGCILREGEYSSERHVTTTLEPPPAPSSSPNATDSEYFETPAVPFLPCLGMAVNWYLVAQLDWTGVLLLCLYLGFAATIYLIGCAPNSVGHNRNWNEQQHYHSVEKTDDDGFQMEDKVGETELCPITGDSSRVVSGETELCPITGEKSRVDSGANSVQSPETTAGVDSVSKGHQSLIGTSSL